MLFSDREAKLEGPFIGLVRSINKEALTSRGSRHSSKGLRTRRTNSKEPIPGGSIWVQGDPKMVHDQCKYELSFGHIVQSLLIACSAPGRRLYDPQRITCKKSYPKKFATAIHQGVKEECLEDPSWLSKLHPAFSFQDADVILATRDAKLFFQVYSSTLKTTSGFFRTTYSLLQWVFNEFDHV